MAQRSFQPFQIWMIGWLHEISSIGDRKEKIAAVSKSERRCWRKWDKEGTALCRGEGDFFKSTYFHISIFHIHILYFHIFLAQEGEKGEEEARKLPVVLAVLAISFGSYIHGTSIVFPDVRTILYQIESKYAFWVLTTWMFQTALAGIKSSSLRLLESSNSTELGFHYDDTKDRAWISNNIVKWK